MRDGRVMRRQCDNYNRKLYRDDATTLFRMNLSGYVGDVTTLVERSLLRAV